MTQVDSLQSTGHRLTVSDAAKMAGEIYSGVAGAIKYKQSLRPYICPFHTLVDLVPRGSSILDVGCGAGVFITMLARLERIRSAVGFDSDGPAIAVAKQVAATFPMSEQIHFEQRAAQDKWPDGRFDVVSVIDVMHHVDPLNHADVIGTAAEHIADGGILIYKDMASRPLWRAWANRLHDLLSVQEWINYAKMDDVIGWARAANLQCESRGAINMLWYRHEWCVFRRPSTAAPSATH